MKTDKCRACPAVIMFAIQEPNAKNPDPKPNPLDIVASENGNLRLNFGTMRYTVLTGKELKDAKQTGEKLYTSHFATCPAKQRFRKQASQSA